MSHGCELVGRLTVPKQLDRARAARSGPGTAGWRGAGFVHPHGAHAEGCRRNVLRCDDSHGVVGAEKNDVLVRRARGTASRPACSSARGKPSIRIAEAVDASMDLRSKRSVTATGTSLPSFMRLAHMVPTFDPLCTSARSRSPALK